VDELIIIIDLEATCWPPGSPERARQAQEAEIIELGAVLTTPLLLESATPPPRFERLIQPTRHPTLTPFCTELTGITTETLMTAPELGEALGELWGWVEQVSDQARGTWRLTLASWGPFDRGILRRQATELGLWLPEWGYVDIKRSFERWCRRHRREGGRFGLRRALDALSIPQEGPAHRALSDALGAWRLWAHIHSPARLTALATSLLDTLIERHTQAPTPTPVLWSKSLPKPLQHKASFERASRELLEANLAHALEHGRGLTLSQRALSLRARGALTPLPNPRHHEASHEDL